jgi:curved DNA-binding protein CbpA
VLGHAAALYPIGTMTPPPDPYATLGVGPSATDAELRAAYRRLVQLHHPDHNGGSPESARRFEAVQEAYAEVRRRRAGGGSAAAGGAAAQGPGGSAGRTGSRGPTAAQGPGGSAGRTGSRGPTAARTPDPEVEARLAAMEQELRAARDARDRAAREARRATEQTMRDVREMAGRRPSDEELGYYTSDDSFSKILDDAASELSERFSEARDSPAGHRVSELIDELAARLTGEHHKGK